MTIKSLSDIPDFLFWGLKQWTDQSDANFNFMLGIASIFLITGILGCYWLYKLLGPMDERVAQIYFLAQSTFITTYFIAAIFSPSYLHVQFQVFDMIVAIWAANLYLFNYYWRKQRN